jgi:colanic acid biosynthesis glycosyl transferase WcaI
MVISEGFKENLVRKGVPASKIVIIPNWVDTDFLKPLPKNNPVARKYGLHDKFVLMYSGTVSISSNVALEKILSAAERLSDEKDVRFVICGDGLKKDDLRKRAETLGLRNVVFLPFQPYADLPALLASSDALLVPLDIEKSQLSVPSKLYNCMAAGRAILGLATEDSEVAAILRETGCGLTADPGDIGAIVETVRALKDGPERRARFAANARRYVTENFAMAKILKEHEDLMESMI